jgi:hypothetical protein
MIFHFPNPPFTQVMGPGPTRERVAVRIGHYYESKHGFFLSFKGSNLHPIIYTNLGYANSYGSLRTYKPGDRIFILRLVTRSSHMYVCNVPGTTQEMLLSDDTIKDFRLVE